MSSYKKIAVIMLLMSTMCVGCASFISRPGKVILLPEERIFSVPAGQKIAVTLDKKPIEMTFPEEMKLVSPTVLVRQEEKLNNAVLDKVKADAENKKKITLWGSIFAILAAALGIFFKMKRWIPKIKFNAEVK